MDLSGVNRHAAPGIRRALDALDAFDESLFDIEFDIHEGEDTDEFINELQKRCESDSVLTALFDILEERLTASLKATEERTRRDLEDA